MATDPFVAPVPDEQHGKRWTYTHHRCRCQVCVEAAAAYRKSRRDPSLLAEDKHGTAYGYQMGCRCPGCTAAMAADHRNKRARTFAERVMYRGELVHPGPEVRHGTDSGYSYYGCRCSACRAYNTAICAERDERRRSR